MTVINKLISQAIVVCLVLFMGSTATMATSLDLATAPLSVQNQLAPNIYLTLDDSGSMAWAYIPDGVGAYYYGTDGTVTREFASSSFNGMYYNPAITYTPPLKADGTSYPDASFTGAWLDGFDQSIGKVDLATEYVPTKSNYDDPTPASPTSAYYYTYTGASGCTPETNTSTCYTKVIVPSSQYTNFANWYSYYRMRTLAAKSAVSLAFGTLGTNFRVAGQNINTNELNPSAPSGVQMLQPFTGTARTKWFTWLINTGASGGTPLRSALNRVGEYYMTSGTDSPYAQNPGTSDGTEYSCRKNFAVVMTDGLWNGTFSPGLGNVDDTDGPSITGSDGNTYQYTVQTKSPYLEYADNNTNSLADVAMYYWDHDLRPDLANNVLPYMGSGATPPYSTKQFYDPTHDPADWQHMDTFTIGLGATGSLDPSTDLPNLEDGTKTWPPTSSNSPNNIDDLWHAAVDGRGQYFSATSVSKLVKAFSKVLDQIAAETTSVSESAVTSGTLTTGTDLINADFNTSGWTGDVIAYKLDSTTGDVGSVAWDANCWLTEYACSHATWEGPTSRQIITADPAANSGLGQGIPFEWSSLLSATQKEPGTGLSVLSTDLSTDPDTGTTDSKGQDRLNYLRGDQSEEQSNTNGTFRTRTSVLGDIVHSSPVYVGPPDDAYGDYYNSATFPEASSYAAFENTYANRTPVVYVGANDGMLHAFDADGGSADAGKELLGFVPSAVMSKLNQLTAPDYTHQYYVDGTPTATDAYFNGAWHTVLVGGLGGGGKEIYCLDITDPSTFSESNAASIVMWEFTAAKAAPYGDPDLGYTYSRPQVVRLDFNNPYDSTNGNQWVVIFGDGYNGADTSGSAHLYVVDLATGKLIERIDTPAEKDPLVTNGTLSSARPDGLATVEPVSTAGNMITDYVYAGDLYGNLWKFDLSSTNPSQWGVVSNKPLFTATDASGNPQPITTKPTVGFNTQGTGYMVYFGTGKYLENSDAAPDTGAVQSIYGIWDPGGNTLTTVSRGNLQQQQIIDQTTADGYTVRVVSQNTVNWATQDGWYLDLEYNSTPEGEMVISDPTLLNGALIVPTFTPSSDPCSYGGTSWLMELDAQTGGQVDYSPFDLNRDGTFDHSDYVTITVDGQTELVPASGIELPRGNGGSPTFLTHGHGGGLYGYFQTHKLPQSAGPGATGRQSWRQLR